MWGPQTCHSSFVMSPSVRRGLVPTSVLSDVRRVQQNREGCHQSLGWPRQGLLSDNWRSLITPDNRPLPLFQLLPDPGVPGGRSGLGSEHVCTRAHTPRWVWVEKGSRDATLQTLLSLMHYVTLASSITFSGFGFSRP